MPIWYGGATAATCVAVLNFLAISQTIT